jgi:hypothetical protein
MLKSEKNETLAKLLKLALIQVPIFILTAIIYILSIFILNDTITNASTSQLLSTLNAIFISFIVLSVIHLLSQLVSFFVNECGLVLLILAGLNGTISLIEEALFFKFAASVNFSNNAIVVARSCLVILLMIFLMGLSLIPIGYTRFSGEKRRYALVLVPLLILPSVVMIVLNAILIAQLE